MLMMMKNLTHAVGLLTLVLAVVASAGDSNSLKWRSFNAGIAEAKKSNKKILVDVYTDWCGWCKRMDKEVYSDPAVAKYLTDRFITVKLDAESNAILTYSNQSMTETDLAQGFGVSGYPTTIFLQSNGEAITLLPGYLPVEKFIDVLKFIGEDHYRTMKFDEYLTTQKDRKTP